MKCHNCGTLTQHGDKFCLKCGIALTANNVSMHEAYTAEAVHSTHHRNSESVSKSLPAEQAEKIIKDAKKIVKHLSTDELIMGGASLAVIIGFFFPWFGGLVDSPNGFSMAITTNSYFLIPLLAFVSLGVLYFSQGAKHTTKIFLSTIEAVVGVYIFATLFDLAIAGGLFGIWLTVIASGVLAGTSIYFQKKILYS